MSPQRVADAAVVSPYPFVVRQERHQQPHKPSQNGPPENADRAPRPPKGKKKPKPPRVVEEEPRFNIGPRNLRPPAQASRPGRIGFRFPGRTYPEDQNGVPDYPPPSFQEAINTPPLSVTSSTVSLVQPNTLPLIFSQSIPEHVQEHPNGERCPREENIHLNPSPHRDVAEPTTIEGAASADDNASVSDESIFIIDPNTVPFSSRDLPKGAELTKRVHTDWKSRRGVEFPGRSTNMETKIAEALGRGKRAPTLAIDIGSKTTLAGVANNASSITSPKRRFLSLSPLKTMFPPKSPVHQDRSMSAHPTPSTSPYSISRSNFFRSSSSLATNFLSTTTLPSNHKSENLSRKIFSYRGKDRLKATPEQLENWELLEEESFEAVEPNENEHPASLMSTVVSMRKLVDPGTSPTRSQSFTFGSQVPHTAPVTTRSQQVYNSTQAIYSDQSVESQLRDWKGPSTAFIDRPINRRPPNLESPSMISIVSGTNTLPSAPMSMVDLNEASYGASTTTLSPVRLRPTSPSPPPSLAYKHTAHVVHSSPLRPDAKPSITIINHQQSGSSTYQRALETPLPVTPVYHTEFDIVGGHGSSNSAATADPPSGQNGPASNSMSDPISDIDAPFLSRTSPQLTIAVQHHLNSSVPGVPSVVVKTNSVDEPMTPTRHHYAGRPLPRPPPTTSRAGVIDSTYASAESEAASKNAEHIRSLNSCPEGLLIDLSDTSVDDFLASGASTPRSEEGYVSYIHNNSSCPTMSREASSVDLTGDTSSLAFNSIQGTSTPLRSGSPGPNDQHSHSHSRVQPGGFSELTELDLLVSGLADRTHDGSDYDTLLLVSEIIGPASPPQPCGPTMSSGGAGVDPTGWGQPPNIQPDPNANISLIGPIEVKRRRKTADGRVKLKLTLLDVAVNKCGICLSQFRQGDIAALTSHCQHSFHEICLVRWLARARSCPLCRVSLDTDVR